MSITITYFVHGTTNDNENDISSGWSDVELSELGIKQSVELESKTEDMHFDVVFTSDLGRALNSAKITWGGKYAIITDPRLRECNYGDFNGVSSNIVEPMQEENIETKFPNGESYKDVEARIKDFLNFLKTNYDGKSIAIVAHKAPQLALDVLLKNMTWNKAFEQDWRKTKSWKPGWKYILE